MLSREKLWIITWCIKAFQNLLHFSNKNTDYLVCETSMHIVGFCPLVYTERTPENTFCSAFFAYPAKWKWKLLSHVRLFATPWTIQSMEFSSQNTGVGSLSLLQGIFPTQGWNLGLLHCRWILFQLSHQERPRILEWVAYPFSRGSSLPRNWTGVSCIVGRFFTSWATREAQD